MAGDSRCNDRNYSSTMNNKNSNEFIYYDSNKKGHVFIYMILISCKKQLWSVGLRPVQSNINECG